MARDRYRVHSSLSVEYWRRTLGAPPCAVFPRVQRKVRKKMIGCSKILQPWGGLWNWSTGLQRRPSEVRLHIALGGHCTRHRRDNSPKILLCDRQELHFACPVLVIPTRPDSTNPKQRFLDSGLRLLLADQRRSQRRIAAPPGVEGRNTHTRMGTCVQQT